ncbi:MAG: ATPase [Desulfurococcales archaeon]|nr:ATPase [Desulfurococcales archaeon]
MGLRVALLSGGKDSFYAAMKYWPVDYGVYLLYDAPVISPHIINLGKSIESLTLSGIKVIVLRLSKGREFNDTVDFFKSINVSEIIAGDVFIEDHLEYMSRLADNVGAKLREPLWGMDTTELAYKEVRDGLSYIIVGVERRAVDLLGMHVDRDSIDSLVEYARRNDIDPVGENGEFHSIVTNSPYHEKTLEYRVVDKLDDEKQSIIVIA